MIEQALRVNRLVDLGQAGDCRRAICGLTTGSPGHEVEVGTAPSEVGKHIDRMSHRVRRLGRPHHEERELTINAIHRPAAVPPEIREVITQRVARLPAGGPELLGRAALIGRDFDLEILSRTTSENEDRIIELLESAVKAGLLGESGSVPGRFTFVPPLVRGSLGDEAVELLSGQSGSARPTNRPIRCYSLSC